MREASLAQRLFICCLLLLSISFLSTAVVVVLPLVLLVLLLLLFFALISIDLSLSLSTQPSLSLDTSLCVFRSTGTGIKRGRSVGYWSRYKKPVTVARTHMHA